MDLFKQMVSFVMAYSFTEPGLVTYLSNNHNRNFVIL